MKFISKLITWHDKLLARELNRPERKLGIPLLISGFIALWGGWKGPDHFNNSILVLGGFALGLAAEKFAQFQIQRIKGKLSL